MRVEEIGLILELIKFLLVLLAFGHDLLFAYDLLGINEDREDPSLTDIVVNLDVPYLELEVLVLLRGDGKKLDVFKPQKGKFLPRPSLTSDYQ